MQKVQTDLRNFFFRRNSLERSAAQVGTLPEAVYGAVIKLAGAFNAQPRDYPGLATALRDMGVVDAGADGFDAAAFAADLERAFAAAEANDAAALASDVVRVSEANNLVLPREFGLLTKQAVYLNRYVSTLAPDLDPFAVAEEAS